MAMSKQEKELEELKKKRNSHQGDWITEMIATDYYKKARALAGKSGEDVGELRKLRIELELKYGITELDAINILNGYHINDIVHKYYRIKNLIPLKYEKVEKYKPDDENNE